MTLSKPIEVEENLEARAKAGVDPPVVLETANTVASSIIEEIAQLLAKNVKSVEKETTLKQFTKVVVDQTKGTTVSTDQRKEREKGFMK